MYLFDRVEEKDRSGTFQVFAINMEDNQAYPLRDDAIISTSASAIEGFSLSISCHPEKYVYRGRFNTESEMKAFADNVSGLLYDANKKNDAIPFAPNVR